MNSILNHLQKDSLTIFHSFENVFIQLIEHRAQKEKELNTTGNYLYYQQEFLKNYFEHFVAIKSMYDGHVLNYRKEKYFLTFLPSIMVLVRSCLENYSLYYYIYKFPKTKQESVIHFNCWWREGLIRRQSFELTEPSLIYKKESEKRILKSLSDELMDTSFFKSLTKKQKQKFILHGSWLFKSYKKLLIIAGVEKNMAANAYNYFSTYTHVTGCSLMQMSQSDTITKKKMMDSFLKILFLVTGSYLFYYLNELQTFKIKQQDWELIVAWQTAMKKSI